MRYLSLLATLLVLGCARPEKDEKDEALQRLDRALREQLGELANPQVAFRRDSTHLQIHLATVAFRTVSDEELTDRAWNVSRFAYSRYDRASEVDSVSVFYREDVRPGLWHIRHSRTFPAAKLRDAAGPIQPLAPDIR